MKNIEILHEDDFSLVINKPAGLAVQGGEGVKYSIDKILIEYFSAAQPLLVHRLDKDTSGVLLIAKGRDAAARFSGYFSVSGSHTGKKAVKLYTAVCAADEMFLDETVSISKEANQKPAAQKQGIITDKLMIRGVLKESKTSYKVIKTCRLPDINLAYSILELEPGTGRMHQIRRHLAMNGYPILGDDKYGDFQLNKKLHKLMGLKRLLLHASRLIIKEAQIDVTAPLPEYFKPFV